MSHFKELATVKKHLQDMLTAWIINLTAFLGVNMVDIEMILKILVLLTTLVYTGIKTLQAIRTWKRNKEIKEED